VSADDAAAEVEHLFALVRERYGDRLTAEQLADLRQTVDGIVQTARALRAVRLPNAAEPYAPFVPYRADP
jgi:hypothetical protein